MSRIATLRAALFNAPLALHLPGQRPGGQAALAQVLDVLGLSGGDEAPPQIASYGLMPQAMPERPYEVLEGVAIIPVHGILVQSLGWCCSFGWATGYDFIRLCLAQALADPEVAAIALHVDSPGGDVSGCFDLADAVFAARGTKPLVAILAERAYSAAYALASACDRITVPRTGGTGSVGVICLLLEFSRMLEEAGVTVHILQHGARKADGNLFQPLPDAAAERFQAQIDTLGALFVETVARNRGLPAADVAAMEAATFLGADGVAAGLADAVMAPDAAFAGLVAAIP